MIYNDNGILKRSGTQFYGWGFNSLNMLFNHWSLTEAEPVQYQTWYTTALPAMKALGASFVRIDVSGMWPDTWTATQVAGATDYHRTEAYYTQLDALLAAAASAGVGVIPVLVWRPATCADLNTEKVGTSIAGGSGKTQALNHITEFVARYHANTTIWGWELSNEVTAKIGPGGFDNWGMSADLGTPAAYAAPDDDAGRPHWEVFKTAAVAAIVAADETYAYGTSKRIISSGNAYGYNVIDGQVASDWATFISDYAAAESQFDVWSVHIYAGGPTGLNASDTFDADFAGLETFLKKLKGEAFARGKAFFVGEFGVPSNIGAPSTITQAEGISRCVTALQNAGVQMAAWWEWCNGATSDQYYDASAQASVRTALSAMRGETKACEARI